MISSTWRIDTVNNTGVALGASDSISVSGSVTTSNSSGNLTIPSSMSELVSGGASLGIGATLAGLVQNSSAGTSVVVSGNMISKATLSVSGAGTLDHYRVYSPDGGTTWPASGAAGIWIASLSVAGSGTFSEDFDLL